MLSSGISMKTTFVEHDQAGLYCLYPLDFQQCKSADDDSQLIMVVLE